MVSKKYSSESVKIVVEFGPDHNFKTVMSHIVGVVNDRQAAYAVAGHNYRTRSESYTKIKIIWKIKYPEDNFSGSFFKLFPITKVILIDLSL